jgi:hypothetical protein
LVPAAESRASSFMVLPPLPPSFARFGRRLQEQPP